MSTTHTPHFGLAQSDQTPATTRRTAVGGELREGLRWAQSVLQDPVASSVHASGMSPADLRSIERAATAQPE
jgi:hypothetical protein